MVRCANCAKEYEEKWGICPYCGTELSKVQQKNRWYNMVDFSEFEPSAENIPKEACCLYPGIVLEERYIIGKVIGIGGFGITYRAWDTKLETVVAVKEYYPRGLVNRVPGQSEVILFTGKRRKDYEAGKERFLIEAKIIARFNTSKHIVNAWEYFEQNQTAYIVMEYLDGKTLNKYLKSNQKGLDVKTSVDIIRYVCAALRDVHKANVIHRDVSPDNIFLCKNGTIKLIDFGTARYIREEHPQEIVILKPGFSPPEQYDSVNEQGVWTDIYALGATLYCLLTGIKPEESTNRKTEDTLLPPNELNPNISEEMSNAIMKAMAVDPHFRFTSVDDFEKSLLGEKKVVSLQEEIAQKRKRRKKGIAIAAGVVCIAGIAVALIWNCRKQEASLPDADITICYMADEDAEKKAQALQSIVEDFEAAYQNVNIEIKGVSTESGLAEVLQADEEHVAIFESTGMELQEDDCMYDLTEIVKAQNSNDYFFYELMQQYAVEGQLITGCNIPMVFYNTTMVEGILTAERLMEYTASESLTDFLAGKGELYISDTSDYYEVQENMPGRYGILSAEGECTYSTAWSIANTVSNDEKKVAIRFLEYMLSEHAQDIWFVQNQNSGLPVQRSAVNILLDVNSEIRPLLDDMEGIDSSNNE